MSEADPRAPVEPVLDVDDIQGIAAPGFFKPYQTLIGLIFPRTDKGVADFQRVIGALEIANCATTLADRRAHRGNSKLVAPPLVAVGIGYLGLADLTAGATQIASEAFKIGLPGRAKLLGDPQDSKGAPQSWVVGAPGAELDALVIVAGDSRASVDAKAKEIEKRFLDIGVKTVVQQGEVLPGDLEGHEHFGFDDGVSQPGIRGRASAAPDDYLTARHVAPGQYPASALYGYPGQDLVWPGEFVIGYPRTSPDPLMPGPAEPAVPAWTRNGSFLVYRRLAQDVHGFWRAMKSEAERLSQLPGFAGLSDVALAAKLVGRWPSGAPVARTPSKDDPKLGDSQLANNHFRFDSDTAALKLVNGQDAFPQATADPIGARCPLAAHIRKVNTRDAPSDMGGRSSTYDRRLLRVGVPFGPPAKDRYATPTRDEPERGLLFLSIQTSIEEQFEFLQARWMNDEARPKAPSGNDLIVGQNAAARDGVRRAVIFGAGLQMAEVRLPEQYVIPTGGGYFFTPSLSALRGVIAPPHKAPAKGAAASAKAATRRKRPSIARMLDGMVACGLAFERRTIAGERYPFANMLQALREIHKGAHRPYPCGGGAGYLGVSARGDLFACHRFVDDDAGARGSLAAGVDRTRQTAWLRDRHVLQQSPCNTCWARFLCGGGCHHETIAHERRSCDYVRGWLHYCFGAYARLSAAAPALFGEDAAEAV